MALRPPRGYRDCVGRRAFACAFLVACCLGCETRALTSGPPVDQNGGAGGNPGDPGNAGTAGAGGRGGDGGGGTGGGGTSGGGNATGSAGSSGDPCAISCGPSACAVRDGQPRVLVTSTHDQIMALAVSADTLFWGTYPSAGPGEIRSMPLAGGPSTLLVSSVVVTELYLDGSTLYYVNDDRRGNSSLLAVPTTGGTPRAVATGLRIFGITSTASYIYFAQGVDIVRVDRAGSSAGSIVSTTGTLWGFAVDDTNVYWASYSNGGTLYARALAGGNVTKLRTSSAPITFPITDGDDIDYMEGINTPATCMSAVWAVSKSGTGAPRQISPGTSGIDVRVPVRDGTTLYWASDSPHGAVLRMTAGQTPEILAAQQVNVSAPVIGPTDIYWIATTPAAYEVRTLPK